MHIDIKHTGIVQTIDESSASVRVKILQTSACSECKAASYCASSESKEKMIDVHGVENVERLNVGQEVVVLVSNSMAIRALLWSFVLPFVLLIVVLFTLILSGVNEITAAWCTLLALIPYYLLLYLLRDKFSKRIYFTLEGY